MYSSKLLSGPSKKTEAVGIQLKTTGSSIGSCFPPIAATPAARSRLWDCEKVLDFYFKSDMVLHDRQGSG